MAFLAIYGTKDEKSPLDTNTLLEAVAKGMTEGKTVLNSKADMIGGYPAWRILIEDADKDKIEARIVFADNRLIQALFVDLQAVRWGGGSWIYSPSSIRTRGTGPGPVRCGGRDTPSEKGALRADCPAVTRNP